MQRVFLAVLFATVLGAAPGLGASPVLAADQDHGGLFPDDEVVLELVVEDWAETTTAKVAVAIELAVEAGAFGQARTAVLRDLKAISSAAPWRIVEHRKLRDDAGFERWRIVAEARLPDKQLSDLPRRVTGASKPGRGFKLAWIDYSPSLAERQALRSSLRKRIYELVKAEIAALNAIFPDREFRIGAVEFVRRQAPMPVRQLVRAAKMQMADAPAGAPGGMAVAQKIAISALVTLAAEPPGQ